MQDGETVWELDASNGYLSYTKMKYIKNQKMVMRNKALAKADIEAVTVSENTVDPFPVCGTSTGWFTEQCGMKRDSDISDLGVGITTYFK